MKLKKVITVVGAGALLLGLGMNLHYAVDDYGIGSNSLNLFVLAQTSSSGGNSTSFYNGHQAEVDVECEKRTSSSTSTGNSSSVSGGVSGEWGGISAGVSGGVSGNTGSTTETVIIEKFVGKKIYCVPSNNYVEICTNFDPCF